MELNGTPNQAQASVFVGVCVRNRDWMKLSERSFWRREWDSNPQSILPVNMALTSNGGIAGRTSFAMDHQT
jgi:hypothetical protein